jgi:transposase-like protein
LDCANCKSERKTKDGIVRGRQRYKCKDYVFRYTIADRSVAKNSLKRLALELYLEGLGFRSIGRILKVSHVSIYNWIRSFGEKVEEIRAISKNTGSKKTTAGYGLLLIDLGRSSWISGLDQGTLQQVESSIKP